MKHTEHPGHLEDTEEYYTQEEMEEIFVKGINMIKKKAASKKTRSVNPTELRELSNKCLNELNGKDIRSEIKEIDEIQDEFHHWFKVHSHNNGHILEQDFKITLDHMEKIEPPSGNIAYYDCNRLVDEWLSKFFTTPIADHPFAMQKDQEHGSLYGAGENVFLFQKRGVEAYFTTASPFSSPGPDVRKITLTKRVPLLIPAYNVFGSVEMYPSLDKNHPLALAENDVDRPLLVEMVSDLLGIRTGSEHVYARFDGQPIEPCCVIRKRPLKIEGIPFDNIAGIPKERLIESGSKIELLHGGFYMLINPEVLTPGDHVVEWEVQSVNYQIHAQIWINMLV
jgi:hypothetical protein